MINEFRIFGLGVPFIVRLERVVQAVISAAADDCPTTDSV
jgi:hypothetical protein